MNEVQNFLFEGAGVRGALVRLEETWQQVLAHHDYPDEVRRLLGESVAATVLLTTGLKGAPKISMQLQGDGPVRLLLSQCSGDLRVRGMAQWRGVTPGRALLGEGRLTVNLDAGEPSRFFQGIVPLVKGELDASLEAYFRQSEQLPTRIVLKGTDRRISGLLLQALPGHEMAVESFANAAALAETVSGAELSDLPAEQLLLRVFSDYSIRLFKPRPVAHDCRCTPDHLASVVRMLGADELESLLEETGQVELNCEFCNRMFRYGEDDVAAILRGETPGQVIH